MEYHRVLYHHMLDMMVHVLVLLYVNWHLIERSDFEVNQYALPITPSHSLLSLQYYHNSCSVLSDDQIGYIAMLAVDKEWRKRKIGALMQHAAILSHLANFSPSLHLPPPTLSCQLVYR
jgi:GNAT superfamily N-acetyltransferase